MEILFVRHGEPAWMPDGFARNDPGLTELGRRQAELLADHFSTQEIDHLWVSPAKRAQETVAPLAEALGREALCHDFLREAAAPDWEGKPASFVRDLMVSGRTRSVEQWWAGLPDGESLRDFVTRIGDGLDSCLGELGAERGEDTQGLGLWRALPKAGRVVVFCHAGTTSVALSHLLGLNQVPWAWERFFVRHASVTCLQTTPVAQGVIFSVRALGDVKHLGEHLSA